jgi:putative salt-induced outer membrane protein YdiY
MNSHYQRTQFLCQATVLAGTCLFLSWPAQAKSFRKDVVVMNNGDRFTGEVKSLQNGVLYVKTDYVEENIGVDWAQVQKVESSAVYQITLVNGVHMTGKIKRESPDESNGKEILIESSSGSTRVPASNVAEISGQKESIWRQLTGSIDAGYSFTSGNSQTTINNDASANYATPNWNAGVALSTSFSGQSDASRTNRVDGTLTGSRFLNHNSYLGLYNDYLHSSQQDLDLRATLGGGYGRYWIRTNTTNLRWIAGAVYARESFSTISLSGQPSDSNLEGLLGASYDSYRFKFGEIHLQGLLFPGMTDAGRIRATTINSLKIKLVNNFYLTFDFWDNYDSRPPTTAKNNELGVSSSIGWSF